MPLSKGYEILALKLQEAGMMHSDVRSRLSDAINDAHRGSGQYGYYIDHDGDGESGDVVYSCNGDIRKCGYEIGEVGGKSSTTLDMENSRNVVPTTSYQEEAEDDDHYASMEESFKSGNIYTDLPLYERFISKSEREGASEGSFAGKGKSFPILKPQDVMAAVRSMGRAGSGNYGMAQLKKNIVSIAKRKGWTKYLPKAWQGTQTSESDSVSREIGKIELRESTAFGQDITIREALSPGKRIKLIAPGKGSTAWYTESALKQAAADKIFKAGTPMRIDHPTKAEEADRPEGSVKDWGAVLAVDAYWADDPKNGKGLYSEIKPFSDHATTIEEKGPYAGVSIRAYGDAVMENKRPVMRDGVPVIERFTSAEGADMVTRAGAGGMFLSEAASAASQTEEVEMTLQEAQRMVNEAVTAATAPFQKRLIESDAREEGYRLLEGSGLQRDTVQRIMDRAMRDVPVKDGALDTDKFREAFVKIAKDEAEYAARLSGAGRVTGLGPSLGGPQLTEARTEEERKAEKKRLKEAKREAKDLRKEERAIFGELMGDEEAAKYAVQRGEAA